MFKLLNFHEPQHPHKRMEVMTVGSGARQLELSPSFVSDWQLALGPGYSLLCALVSSSGKEDVTPASSGCEA